MTYHTLNLSQAFALSRMVAAVLALLVSLSVLVVPVAAQSTEAVKTFSIPAEAAGEALKRFVEQSGVQLLYANEQVEGVRTRTVEGDYTPAAALALMLRDTELEVTRHERTGALAVKRAGDPNGARAVTATRQRPERLATTRAEDGTVVLEEVEVTGSRIRGLLGEADFSPVLSFSRSDIERSGITTVGEIARLIPQVFFEGGNSYEGMGIGGQNQGTAVTSDGSLGQAVRSTRSTFNLRGLGAANTLVLIDGRRIARTGTIRGAEAYDLTALPVAMIERVEILTDGASAIYGSDAVGGVINFILRKNYSGTELSLSYENTFSSDTAVRTINLTHAITRSRWSLSLSGSFQDRNAFAAVDRPFSATDDWASLGGTTGLGTGAAGSFAAGGFATGAGIVQAVSGQLPGVGSNFAVIPDGATGVGLTPAAFLPVTGNSFGVPAYTGDRAKYANLISPQTNVSGGYRFSFRVNPSLEVFTNGSVSKSVTDIEGFPVNFRNSMIVPANYPGNPFGVNVRLNKTFWELPNIQGAKTAETRSENIALGLRGTAFHDWRYEGGFDWSRGTLQDRDGYDPVLLTPVYNDLIAARSLVLFYDSRTSAPNDLDMLKSMLRPVGNYDQFVSRMWSTSADGPIWDLPAGPVRLAVGGEFRTESVNTSQATPEAPNINLSLLGSFQREVGAAYVESRIPLVGTAQDVTLVHRLDASLALRYDDYSDFGNALNPRYGLQYRPAAWLLLRGSRNYAFRAPTLQAIYRPITQSTNANSAGFIDPVSGQLITGVIATRIGGNPDLKPEETTSTNFGLVFEPPVRGLKGLSFAVDYLDIVMKDRVGGLASLQEWADLVPERLIRNDAGQVVMVDTRSINIASVEVTTIDYQINYRRETAMGQFDLRAAASTYRTWDSIRVPGAVPVTSLHQRPTRMSWQAYWSKGPYGAGVSGIYQKRMYTNATQQAYLFASAVEWNTQFAYDFGYNSLGRDDAAWRRWLLADSKLSISIFNVLDRRPPARQGQAGFGVTDPRMARYVISLRRNF